jgi:hypothetical protein
MLATSSLDFNPDMSHRGPRLHKRPSTQARSATPAVTYTKPGHTTDPRPLGLCSALTIILFLVFARQCTTLTQQHLPDLAHGEGREATLLALTYISGTQVTTVPTSYFSLAGCNCDASIISPLDSVSRFTCPFNT